MTQARTGPPTSWMDCGALPNLSQQGEPGFARNNNRIAGEAKGDYLCFLNNDVFVDGDWLIPMLAVFESKEKVGMVGNASETGGISAIRSYGVVFAPQGNLRHYGQGFLASSLQGRGPGVERRHCGLLSGQEGGLSGIGRI